MSTTLSNPSENRGPLLVGVAISATGIAMVVMSTRLWVRSHMIRNIGNDDWIMSATTFISIAGMAVVIAEVQYGVGRHLGDIDLDLVETGFLLNLVTQLIYLWGICLAKLSVGTSLLRIASTKFWKHTILGFMAFVLLYTTIGFITILSQCSDIRALWISSVKATATCWPGEKIQVFSYVNFSLNILSDLVFSIGIPLPMLWNVNVSRRTKLSLFFVLGLGCFATACAVVRITYLGTYGASGDWLWDTVDLARWSIMELNISIVAGSLPSLRPLFKKFLGTVYGAGSRHRGAGGEYGHGTGNGTKASRRGPTNWQPFSSAEVKELSGGSGRTHPRTNGPPARPLDRSLDDGGSQVKLSDNMQGRSTPDSFELSTFKVESRITTDAPTPWSSGGLSRKGTNRSVGGGITKTTTTTVSYDDPRKNWV